MEAKELLRNLGENLTVGRAFGPSYEIGGTTIIPVALVAGGGGGGEGRQLGSSDAPRSSNGEKADENRGEGSGGGFGGVVYPLGAYVVQGERVRFVPSFDITRLLASLLALLRLVVKRSTRTMR